MDPVTRRLAQRDVEDQKGAAGGISPLSVATPAGYSDPVVPLAHTGLPFLPISNHLDGMEDFQRGDDFSDTNVPMQLGSGVWDALSTEYSGRLHENWNGPTWALHTIAQPPKDQYLNMLPISNNTKVMMLVPAYVDADNFLAVGVLGTAQEGVVDPFPEPGDTYGGALALIKVIEGVATTLASTTLDTDAHRLIGGWLRSSIVGVSTRDVVIAGAAGYAVSYEANDDEVRSIRDNATRAGFVLSRASACGYAFGEGA